jgi:hypothetical protein
MMVKIFKLFKAWMIPVLLVLILTGYAMFLHTQLRWKEHQIEKLRNNIEAYEDDILGYKTKGGIYNFSMEEITHSLDSTIMRLNSIRKELDIKEKQIREMSAIKTVLRDTTTIYVYKDKDSIPNCDFEIKHEFNPWTKLDLELTSGKLKAEIDVTDNYYLFCYTKQE